MTLKYVQWTSYPPAGSRHEDWVNRKVCMDPVCQQEHITFPLSQFYIPSDSQEPLNIYIIWMFFQVIQLKR